MLPDARADQLATSAAKHYKRKCWWADFDDLKQVAALTIVQASKTYDPRVGVPEDAYCWRAIINRIQRHLWAASSPVSGGSHRPRESYKGLHRAPLPPEDMPAWATDVPSAFRDHRTPESLVSDREWEMKVRARLVAISVPELVDAVLDETRVAEVAKKLSVSSTQVRFAVSVVQKRAAADPQLNALYRDRFGRSKETT